MALVDERKDAYENKRRPAFSENPDRAPAQGSSTWMYAIGQMPQSTSLGPATRQRNSGMRATCLKRIDAKRARDARTQRRAIAPSDCFTFTHGRRHRSGAVGGAASEANACNLAANRLGVRVYLSAIYGTRPAPRQGCTTEAQRGRGLHPRRPRPRCAHPWPKDPIEDLTDASVQKAGVERPDSRGRGHVLAVESTICGRGVGQKSETCTRCGHVRMAHTPAGRCLS